MWPATPRPPPLPTGRALVRRASGDMAGSPRTARPLARPYGGTSVSDDARRARSGAPRQRSDQQSAKESARALSTLPHTARSAAPFGAALDHLPPALGSRRSLPWSVPGNDRRADIKTDVARVHRGFASSRPPPSRGLPLKNGKKRPRPLQPEQPERRVRPNVQRNPNKAMRRGRVDAGAGFSEATIGIKAATNQIGAAKVLGSL